MINDAPEGYEPVAFTLAWVAFRHDALLAGLRDASGPDGPERVLRAAIRVNMGLDEDGPRRPDGHPFVNWLTTASIAAHHLTDQLRRGAIHAVVLREGAFVAAPADWWGRLLNLVLGETGIHFGFSGGAEHFVGVDLKTLHCRSEDVRKVYHPEFTLLWDQGVWRPHVHVDPHATPPTPPHAAQPETAEAKAIRLLAGHLAKLTPSEREAYRRADAMALVREAVGIGARAFNRVWSEARRRAGLPPRAPAGPKRKPQSRRRKA